MEFSIGEFGDIFFTSNEIKEIEIEYNKWLEDTKKERENYNFFSKFFDEYLEEDEKSDDENSIDYGQMIINQLNEEERQYVKKKDEIQFAKFQTESEFLNKLNEKFKAKFKTEDIIDFSKKKDCNCKKDFKYFKFLIELLNYFLTSDINKIINLDIVLYSNAYDLYLINRIEAFYNKHKDSFMKLCKRCSTLDIIFKNYIDNRDFKNFIKDLINSYTLLGSLKLENRLNIFKTRYLLIKPCPNLGPKEGVTYSYDNELYDKLSSEDWDPELNKNINLKINCSLCNDVYYFDYGSYYLFGMASMGEIKDGICKYIGYGYGSCFDCTRIIIADDDLKKKVIPTRVCDKCTIKNLSELKFIDHSENGLGEPYFETDEKFTLFCNDFFYK